MFDIDGLLCWQRDVEMLDCNSLTIEHPECKLILHPVVDGIYIHCFIPYVDVLFEYLINSNNRIAFFSAGMASRNIPVIETLLVDLFGRKQYKYLKEEGQFEIFSSHHLRNAIPENGEVYVKNIKDLNIVLKENETLDNTILVEDHYYYGAHDQMPCILGLMLDGLLEYPGEKNFSKNATYYLLGLFKQYVTSSIGLNQEIQPIRTWFKQFLLDNKITDCSGYTGYYYNQDNPYDNKKIYHMPYRTDPLVINSIISGFEEVKKKYPQATLYAIKNTIDQDATSLLNINKSNISLGLFTNQFEFVNNANDDNKSNNIPIMNEEHNNHSAAAINNDEYSNHEIVAIDNNEHNNREATAIDNNEHNNQDEVAVSIVNTLKLHSTPF